jgi:hypothetical protein
MGNPLFLSKYFSVRVLSERIFFSQQASTGTDRVSARALIVQRPRLWSLNGWNRA